MGLSALIQQSLINISQADEDKWRQFILDHLDYITRRSTKYSLDGEVANRYRYDLDHFLKKNMQRSQPMAWIVLSLNGMKNDFEFSGPCDLVIPSDSLIRELYDSFITIQKNQS